MALPPAPLLELLLLLLPLAPPSPLLELELEPDVLDALLPGGTSNTSHSWLQALTRRNDERQIPVRNKVLRIIAPEYADFRGVVRKNGGRTGELGTSVARHDLRGTPNGASSGIRKCGKNSSISPSSNRHKPITCQNEPPKLPPNL